MGKNNTHDRLSQAVDYLKYKKVIAAQTDIAKRLGRSREAIARALSGNPNYLTDKFLELFALNFSEYINPVWLLSGEGEMLGADTTAKNLEQTVETRPRIPVDASAGFLSGIAEGVKPHECEQVPIIPGVPDYACTIVVRGDSMTPKYESGDELALVPLRDVRAIQWGHVYILDTRDGVLLKRLYDNKDSIRCVSYNPEYPDSFVDKSSINSIWRVVALLRRF